MILSFDIRLVAKQRGLVPAIAPLLTTLRNEGFRMSEPMFHDALFRARE